MNKIVLLICLLFSESAFAGFMQNPSSGGGSSSLVVGTTTITGGASGNIEFNNGGVLGELSTIPVTNGGTGTGTAFTQGSVVFAGASGIYSQNNPDFFWDNTDHWLGIGTAVPTGALTAYGTTAQLIIGNPSAADVGEISLASNSALTITTVGATNQNIIINALNNILFQDGGVSRFSVNGAQFQAVVTNGSALNDSTGISTTLPNILPDDAATTTGFAAGSAGNINAIVAGVEITRWTGTGLGIGTTSPLTSFDVETSSQFNGIFAGNKTNIFGSLTGDTAANDGGLFKLLLGGATDVQIAANATSYFNGGSVGIGTATPRNSAVLDVNGLINVGALSSASSTSVCLSGSSTGTLAACTQAGTGAEQTISYQPGLLSAVNATKGVYGKFVKASTLDNIEGSAITFSCIANPTITLTNCHADATCATSPTSMGTVTVTASGQAFDGTITSSAIAANEYVAWAITAGTCASLDISATAQIHAN